MDRRKRWISIILLAAVVCNMVLLPASAEELLPNAPVPAQTEGTIPQDTVPEETLPQETVPQETVPQETVPQETVPQETVPQETVPQEPVPEETVPEETIPQEMLPEETIPEETIPEETAPKAPYNPVPRFYQTDYPDTRYGAGTVATCGCSITCVAMVAGYLTGYVYFPDQLAKWFGGKADNNMARMEYAARMLELPFYRASNILETFQALEEGKIAIVLMNEKSVFTDSQHFIVLAGLTEDGKILVNDPYQPNYEDWRLSRGLTWGFDREDILCGYSGAWIFDREAVSDTVSFYCEPEPDYENPRYPGLSITALEWDLLARVVWVEARGESFEGQQAVAEVVLNRMMSPGFPDSMEEVIFGQGQFRSVPYLDTADPNQTQYDAIEAALYGPYVLDEEVFYFAREPVNDRIWGRIGGHIFCYG